MTKKIVWMLSMIKMSKILHFHKKNSLDLCIFLLLNLPFLQLHKRHYEKIKKNVYFH